MADDTPSKSQAGKTNGISSPEKPKKRKPGRSAEEIINEEKGMYRACVYHVY